MELAGKNGLVLGASRGIGLATARALAARGVRLALTWYDWPEASKKMRDEFAAMSDEHLVVRVDLRRPQEVRQLLDRIGSRFGNLHILVNNIERGGMPVVHGSYQRQVNRDQWQREMETTLRAKWLVFEQSLPLLRAARQAAVVNISSIAGIVGRSGPAGLLFNDGYAAANRGVSSFTETWARLGAPSIRVNEIMLGIIESRHGPGTRGWDLLSAEQKRDLLAHTLLGRTGTTQEVVRAILFLLEDADFMTGSVIRLDGGYVLGAERVPAMPEGVI
ncbi:MAG TPA: SDR family oxidoreductase [Desulfobulbus sp.]|nr:SDR family oxidoreductase [Desulfobulbus sp.]